MYIQRGSNKWWVYKYNLYGVVIQRGYCVVLRDIIGGDSVLLCDKKDGVFWYNGDGVVIWWKKGGDGVGICKIIGGDDVVSYEILYWIMY